MRDLIPLAKERLTIPMLWERLNLGACKRMNKSPWRNEKTASLSVSADGKLFYDFGSGQGGDAITFLSLVLNLSKKEAIKTFLEMAGVQSTDGSTQHVTPVKKPPVKVSFRSLPSMPTLGPLTSAQVSQLAALRRVSEQAVWTMMKAGFLFAATCYGHSCWVITDSTRVNAQARRFDGCKFGERKALTVSGSWASWPVGITDSSQRIVLVEGGPDMLAAFDAVASCIRECSPVCMFGAGSPIHASAIPLFMGKEVFAVPHNDAAGAKAFERWSAQLKNVADVYRIPIPAHHKDLNDFVSSGGGFLPRPDSQNY